MSPIRAAELTVDIVAHRGASFDAPENTLAAFRLAWEQGADLIEGDFRLTRDGGIVCIHDATTDRTTGHKSKVVDSTLAELQMLDAGSWKSPAFKGERLPSIQQVLALVPPDKRILIEIKSGPEIVPPLKKVLAESSLAAAQTIIIAFDQKVIAASKEQMPERKAYLLFDFKQKEGKWNQTPAGLIRTAKALRADGIDVGLRAETRALVDEAFARQAHDAGLELHVWTVNDVALARHAIQIGAKSITTDKPRWLREQLQQADAAEPRQR